MAQTSNRSENVVPMKPSAKKAASKAKTKKKTASVSKAKPSKKAGAKTVASKKASKAKASTKAKSVKKTASKKTTAKKAVPKKVAAFSSYPLNATLQPTTQDMEKIMTQSKNQFDQYTKEASAASKDSVDAFVKSGTIFAKGMETIIRESIEFAQAAAEKQAQFAKDAMSAKTINEFSEIQNKIAQANFDDFMSSATKITELGTKVLSEAIEPINNQMTKVVQKATDAVAAE